MLEKEIKILEINRGEVEKKLLDLGAEKIFEGYIHDVYYDFPLDTKNKLESNGRMFRLRKKGEEHIYTIKNKRHKIGKQEGVVAKDEHETTITDIESFSRVLEKYDMKKNSRKEKTSSFISTLRNDLGFGYLGKYSRTLRNRMTKLRYYSRLGSKTRTSGP